MHFHHAQTEWQLQPVDWMSKVCTRTEIQHLHTRRQYEASDGLIECCGEFQPAQSDWQL